MKKIIFSIILILVLAFPAFAANHYILAGATGTATGADWTNAWTSFPATSALVRGDTYYVGVGTYTFDGAPYNISNAVSGDLYITFQKATIADHGTGTGWDSSYAGQAILTRTTMAAANQIEVIEITTSYITINGAVGSGPDTTSYGFKITPPTVGLTSYSQGGIILYQGSSNISNISVQHIAFIGAGNTSPGSGSQTCNGGIGSGYNQPGSISNIDFEYNYFYNFTDSISLIKTYTGTIAHNYFAENWSDSAYCHGQQLAADATSDISVFDNTFNAAEYAVLGAHSNVGSNLRWNIYNNIILNNWVSMYAGDINNGVFNGWVDGGIGTNYVGNTLQNFKIYQNTYVGVAVGTWGLFNPGPLSDPSNMQSQFYNNLIYNSSNPRILCDSTHYVCVAGAGCSYSTTIGSCSPTSGLHDYNAFLKCTGTYPHGGTAETNGQVDANASNPLNADYTINQTADTANAAHVIDTGNAAIIASPWNIDATGINARPYSGTNPDIGAYEYIGGGVTQYAVTPTLAGSGCTMSPNTVTQVISGESLQLTSSCQNGFQATWSGNCGGSASAYSCVNDVCTVTYTSSAITADCTIIGTFTPIPCCFSGGSWSGGSKH